MVLTSFLVGLTLVLAALFVLVVRAIALWKDGKRVGGVLSSELDSFEERSARTEQLLAEADRGERGSPGGDREAADLPSAPAGASRVARDGRPPHALAARVSPSPMSRVAAVDLGTNSTRLLVADVDGDELSEVARRLTITRLGEGVDERRRLLPVPIARVRNCLTDYRRELEELGATRTLAIGTSAIRDAENGEAFLGEVEWSYGFTTRLLDGAQEAALMVRGVSAGRASLDNTLVVDIGGGSTELVLAVDGAPVTSSSLDVGCVRITERFLRTDPPSRPELAAAAGYVRSLLPAMNANAAIGVAGTVTTLATLHLGDAEYDPARTHGHRVPATAVAEQLERLAEMPLEERTRVPGIEPGRAPVIVAGLVVLREIMEAYSLSEIEVSERDILHGAALAAAELPEPEEGAAPPGAYTCC